MRGTQLMSIIFAASSKFMLNLGLSRSDVIALVALIISGVSLVISYQVYKEETTTDFDIRVEPLYYSEIRFRYHEEDNVSAAKATIDERGRAIAPDHLESHRVTFPATATITIPVSMVITNNSRRNIPIKRSYFVVVDQMTNASSPTETMHLSERKGNDTEHPRLPINIPAGESKELKSELSVVYEEPIASQLRSIFETGTRSSETKLQSPSLARLNFFAIASEQLKDTGGSPYPYLSIEFLKTYKILVGIEDYTGNSRLESVKFLFNFQEFPGFILASPGETASYQLSPDQRTKLGVTPKTENGETIIIKKEDMLSRWHKLILRKEGMGECCTH